MTDRMNPDGRLRKVDKMLRTFAAFTLVTLGLISVSGAQSIRKAVDPEIEAAVMRVLDEFLFALNNGDLAAQQRAMHFPHYRLANGTMTVLDQPGAAGGPSIGIRRTDPDWHHTKWDRRNIVGWSSEKVHVDTQFTRYREDDTPIASYESLYVVTKDEGRWAIKMRSRFVP
jgi:hypothetical protein